MNNNQTLTLKTNYQSAKAVCADIKVLGDAFRKHYRKGESVDLVYSQGGDLKNPTHNLAVWFGSDNVREINFIKDLINKA